MNSGSGYELNSKEFETLVLCSFRYAIDRNTGIGYEISEIIVKHKDKLAEWVRNQIKRDINFKVNTEGFNCVEDLDNWNRVKDGI